MKNLINIILGFFDKKLISKSSYKKITSQASKFKDYEFLEQIDEKFITEVFNNLKFSKSQLRQDLFVLSELGFKKKGYFVEFGATDGIKFSNTYLMESKFSWTGILAEPAKFWHSSLIKNRSAIIETDCVWRTTNEKLLFNEVYNDKGDGELSTIDRFSKYDFHHKDREKLSKRKYMVRTISLEDMLKKHKAPQKIDYLSIDTEGSEYEIIKNFNFNNFDIKVITCEHNYMPDRNKIYKLLLKNGYERKFSNFSEYDDWYVKRKK